MNKLCLCAAGFSLLSPCCAFSNEMADEHAVQLSHMIVVANKSPRPITDVVGAVTTFTARDIANTQSEDFDDILRFQPNINMESTGSRFQSSSINIRGIGDNRVAIEVDGVPSTDQFDIGAFSNSGRLFPEVDLIKNIEILNGPASTLYGSDAIGGVLAVTTWDPADLTRQADGHDFYKLRLGYEGKNHSQVASGLAAWQEEKTGLLLSLTHRHGKGINNDKFVTLQQDKLDWNADSFFAKSTFALQDTDLLTVTIQAAKKSMTSENDALLGVGRQFQTSTRVSGDDQSDMLRISLEYQFSSDLAFFEDNVLRIYYLDSDTTQKTVDFRSSHGQPVKQNRDFYYQQHIIGLEFNSFTRIGRHQLVTGIDFSATRTKERRDAAQTNLTTGSVTKTLLGETFPLRDFPESTTTELGLFVQDEIALNGQWQLVPAIRFDYYHLNPQKDPLYLQNNTNANTVSITETAISPKLGILRQLDHNISIYAQYVRGFRAPPFEDANIGLDIPLFKIRAIPNPDLKSEVSDGFELGFRQGQPGWHLSAALFYTHYKDFIETKVKLGQDSSGTTLFQSRNLNKAEIYGFELSHKANPEHWHGWSVATRLAFTRGNNLDTHQPINSISPAQAIIDLGWHSANRRWQYHLVSTLTKAKTRVDETRAQFFKPDGYVIFDLRSHYQISRDSRISLGISNLTNQRYWRWQDVRNLDPNDQLIQAVTRPERNVSLTVTTQW